MQSHGTPQSSDENDLKVGLDPIRISDTLRGKSLMVIGATGFLGKVFLYLLLNRHADLKRIYVLIRPKKGMTPQERFIKEVIPAEVFDPLRERLGLDGFQGLVDEKLVAVAGDITLPFAGISEEMRDEMRGTLDVLINSSGLVDFTPPLNEAISINALGVQHAVDAAVDVGAKYMAISTCYVAGAKTGRIFEDEPIYGYFPRKAEMQGVTFDPRREIEEGLQLVARAKEEAFHQEHQSIFIHEARTKLIENHRNPDDPESLAQELKRVRDRWVKRRLSEVGARRAESYGWSNTYTYTKSLGEQLVVSTPNLEYTIVRPAIIESSLRHPFPGWNEGINTTAPLIFLTLQGQLRYPSTEKHPLDIIPVDMIAGPMVAITAALILGRAREVYQLGSSDSNPASLRRVVELTGLYKRRYYQKRTRGNAALNKLYATIEPRNITEERYNKISSPYVGKKAGEVSKLMDDLKLVKRMPFLKPVQAQVKALEKQSQRVDKLMQVFMPFISRYKYRFKTDNVRALYAELSPEDRAAIPFDPESIDWLTYWIYVHVVGLETWVFPKIKDRLKRNPLPKVYTYEDLLELFDATTTNNSEKVAFRILKDKSEEAFTYAEVRERAGWVAQRLRKEGVSTGDRVLIVSENRPEWGMSYFGILQTGASAVPVDAKSSAREVVNLTKAAEAKVILVSPEIQESLKDAWGELPGVLVLPFEEVFGEPVEEAPKVALVPATQGDKMASLIFTSGTTGVPKGVMLSHRNLTGLLSDLAKIFRLNDRDRVLSVLPLHHTFEFTAGFLLPLSRGSTITYIETLNGETLTDALQAERATAMVGVPALWELIHRRIVSKVEERGALAEALFLGLSRVSRTLREKAGINLGKLLFGEVHRTFGGKLRYLISGAAALPKDVYDGFDALGFDLYEGYGLTEASPVLAVNRPGHRPVKGSVGTALPSVDIKILNPNAEGLGEIIARGPNVMEGYLNNQEATEGVIKNGWLHTGDIGRIGKGGNVYIMGRAKEIIVDGSGKNVYPDEIEDLYTGAAYLKELSVVGLPDDRGSERVAALAVLDEEKIASDGITTQAARARVEDHVRHIELTLPYHQRIKVLRFKEGDLPRTSSRKVKRREVIKLLQGMLSAENTVIPTTNESGGTTSSAILTVKAAIARITGKAAAEIRAESRLDADLGMDSLMATELVGALEEHGAQGLELQDLVEATTVGGVADLIGRRSSSVPLPVKVEAKDLQAKASDRLRDVFDVSLDRLHEVHIPEDIRLPIKDVLGVLQNLTYNQGFKVKVKGLAFLPQASNVLVIANHSSHLDMGLVKVALGGYGKNLVTMAAADYFFSDGPRRFYFENFTNAIPLDRIVPKRQSIRHAQILLEEGNNLLMFPEGTRSLDGTIQPFKRGVGMMSLRFGVDVLPVYLDGTYRVLPKGAWLPKSREMELRIGAPIRNKDLRRLTEGMSPLQAQTLVARLLQRAVESLRDHKVFDLEAAAKQEAGGGPSEHPLVAVMDELRPKYLPGEFKGPVTYYFSLGKGPQEKWTLTVDKDGPTFQLGKHGSADCVLKTNSEIFAKIVREGYQPGVNDFMSGTIKTNDIERLSQFQMMFGLGDF